jgi:hypothetical protein
MHKCFQGRAVAKETHLDNLLSAETTTLLQSIMHPDSHKVTCRSMWERHKFNPHSHSQ